MCLLVHVASLTLTQPGDQPISPHGCCTLTLTAQSRVTPPLTALCRSKHGLTLTHVEGGEGEGERLSKGMVNTVVVLLRGFALTQTAAGMIHTRVEFNFSLLHFCVACFRICLSVIFFFTCFEVKAKTKESMNNNYSVQKCVFND